MPSSIDRLKQLLSPPDDAPGVVDWGLIEERLEVGLPNDYKEFVRFYGNGTIEGFMMTFLMAPNVDNGIEWWEEQLWVLRQLSEDVPESYVIASSGANLLPWAYTIDNDLCYLWMEPLEDPDRWWVVSRTRDMDWSVFEGSMIEFLVEIISGSRREVWMPRDFPGEYPWFKTTAQYLADTNPE
ncbi:hypothetical protein SAMN04487820_101491 [Actinopolyspora mzabensis]|uniref:Knr4/Smi1-like domain-containing protein n=1 Tax=Actinopolyspora mzabensis TaxID=995066 RepID=A0A1G8W2Z3_ACTMZ|nr:SMI1/KNR4 family protein [Actinopolyspora mzabensis]SDJ72466.1 hypothetical protein SAMN04487820_101491 [Actinopolyspora mzabensis]